MTAQMQMRVGSAIAGTGLGIALAQALPYQTALTMIIGLILAAAGAAVSWKGAGR